ncbi:MAG: hypothetical protein AAF607_00700 [Pseudomonadota bacterium]
MAKRRVKLKLGLAEVEIEGDQDKLHEEAFDILKGMVELVPSSHSVELAPQPIEHQDALVLEDNSAGVAETKTYDFSVETLITHMGHESAADVILAACTYLHFVEEKPEFGRSDILEAAKLATAYYKKTIGNNLTHTLNSLLKTGKLLGRSSGKYALSMDARNEALKNLAELG